MNSLSLSRYALGVCVVAILFAGCAGSQLPIGAPGAMQQSVGIAAPESAAAARTIVHRPYRGGSPLRYALLYIFRKLPDAEHPAASLVEVNGTLYGTTYGGGAHGVGTVFSITTGGIEKVLYSFAGGADGSYPVAGLVDVKGTLYGTTQYGGSGSCSSGCGTVFRITTGGTEKVVYSFAGGSNGAGPVAGLIDVSGTLYGTMPAGGAHNQGMVYSITTRGKEKVVYSFAGGTDAATPEAELVNVKGTLYGTTLHGGSGSCSSGCGTVFKITMGGTEKVLYSFAGGVDGSLPAARLINVKTTLYGTTFAGGPHNIGTIFKIKTSGAYGQLYSFGGSPDGSSPDAGLIDVSGTLYGTTYQGGTYYRGTVFSITTGGREKVLHSFSGGTDGDSPEAALLDVNGTLYSTTYFGGHRRFAGHGTIFGLTP